MAIPWMTALKLVPWTDVIQAAPQVLKTAKGLLKKSPPLADPVADLGELAARLADQPPADNAGELALQHLARLQTRVQQLEQAQRDSASLLEQMAQQQAQLVQTVGLLRTAATRLVWTCTLLGACVLGLGLYLGVR